MVGGPRVHSREAAETAEEATQPLGEVTQAHTGLTQWFQGTVRVLLEIGVSEPGGLKLNFFERQIDSEKR